MTLLGFKLNSYRNGKRSAQLAHLLGQPKQTISQATNRLFNESFCAGYNLQVKKDLGISTKANFLFIDYSEETFNASKRIKL